MYTSTPSVVMAANVRPVFTGSGSTPPCPKNHGFSMSTTSWPASGEYTLQPPRVSANKAMNCFIYCPALGFPVFDCPGQPRHVEQAYTAEIKGFQLWRKGRDSNPRPRHCEFVGSRRLPSTTERNRFSHLTHDYRHAGNAPIDFLIDEGIAPTSPSANPESSLPIGRRPESSTQVRNQRQDLGRCALCVRIGDEDVCRLCFSADIQQSQFSRLHRIVKDKRGEQSDAQTFHGRFAHGDPVVDTHDRPGPNDRPAARLPEAPI